MAPLMVKLDAATYNFCIADANIDQRRLHIKNIQLLLNYLGGSFKAGMRPLGWQFRYCVEIIWVASVRME